MKQEILRSVQKMFRDAGFKVSEEHHMKGISFDIVARRDDVLLFIKVLANVDTLKEDTAEEMRVLSKILEGVPLVVGLHSGSSPLEDGVVYTRFGVPVISPGTLYDLLVEGVPPLVFAAPGGFYVNLDGERLKEIRRVRNLSLGDLAEAAGVSRRTIQLYEETGRGALAEVALRIEEFLDVPLLRPIDLFSFSMDDVDLDSHMGPPPVGEFWENVFRHLIDHGCFVVSTERSPFESVVDETQERLLTGVGRYTRTTIKKARVIGNVSEVIEKRSFLILDERKHRMEIGGVPVVEASEVVCRDPEELLELLQDREKKKKREE